jgi:hypothetical protein
VTLKELRLLLPYWQRELNLGNWKITVQRGNASTLKDNVGRNVFSTEEETSDIYMARGQGEETLVHELLHLVYDDHKPADVVYDPLHERALNRTARALVNLRLQLTEWQERHNPKTSEIPPS